MNHKETIRLISFEVKEKIGYKNISFFEINPKDNTLFFTIETGKNKFGVTRRDGTFLLTVLVDRDRKRKHVAYSGWYFVAESDSFLDIEEGLIEYNSR